MNLRIENERVAVTELWTLKLKVWILLKFSMDQQNLKSKSFWSLKLMMASRKWPFGSENVL